MMVTFVSQCEYKALNRTRRVLDAFANRIGTNTWQTVITEEGLQAVKKLLRKSATKNTAVSCHWIRSRSRSDVVWIVGKRSKFSAEGFVPVNWTQKNIINNQWENDWSYLPLIKSLTAIAALFHDWGKASACFQEKLNCNSKNKFKGDPLRHEWVSVLLLSTYVNQQDDEQWLKRLAGAEFDESALIKTAQKNIKNPLKKLPPLASLIGWLIVSHHRLPLPKNNQRSNLEAEEEAPPHFQYLLDIISANFGYENLWMDEQQERLKDCFIFPHGLPCRSVHWVKQAQKWAAKLSPQIETAKPLIENGSWRLLVFYARLSLMLGDHYYSSQEKLEKWQSDYRPIANTYSQDVSIAKQQIKKGSPKQKLDQHLIGVKESALTIAQLLPAFETELKPAYDIKKLKQKSPASSVYYWQDKAVIKIQAWKNTLSDDKQRFGFFSVNMASTGCGKTLANAKIMQALSENGESLRYILALGLRTLTLQTGDEYRDRIGLGDDELAVMIGSRAIMELHSKAKAEKQEGVNADEATGSESQAFLLDDNVIDYDCPIPDDKLTTVLKTERNKQFLYAPVLACTIDHIMPATETKRGGRYILPSLRLMSSDLVIDEIDDFTGHDLIAIGRLIHLAGMLGRKVMISSATIPPDLAVGYFNAYQQGWKLFAQTRNLSQSIGCAWIDEDKTNIQVHSVQGGSKDDYQTLHQSFIDARIKFLKSQKIKRKATLIPCSKIKNGNESLKEHYFSCIQKAIIQQHQQHSETDSKTQKHVSFGVVRMANISPCVALTQYLAKADWGDDIDIRIMTYHSQQLLLLRHEQEKHLDSVLKRNTKKAGVENSIIKGYLQQNQTKNMIFIVVATPVEEVGRDHDFDWAVVEPSSFRSIIQLAGRVLRHREKTPETANIALMQHNLKALQNADDSPAYTQPGYESSQHLLPSHDLNHLLSESIQQRVDATPRIDNNPELKNPFADLEHRCIGELLTSYDNKKVNSLQGWLTECWWLTALPQELTPFRQSQKQRLLYLVPKKEEWVFVEKDDEGKLTDSIEGVYKIKTNELTEQHQQRLWLERDYVQLIEVWAELLAEELDKPLELARKIAASRYGEISCRENDLNSEVGMRYSNHLGMVKSD